MRAAAVRVDRVAEREAGAGHRVDDLAGVHVQELESAVFAGPDVAGRPALVGEERPRLVGGGERPAEAVGGARSCLLYTSRCV